MHLSTLLKSALALLFTIVAVQGYLIFDLKRELASNVNQSRPDNLPVMQTSGNTVNTEQASSAPKQLTYKTFDPYKELEQMRKEMQKTFESFDAHFIHEPIFSNDFKSFSHAAHSDIQDMGSFYEIKIDIPDADESAFDINIRDNILYINANSAKSKEENGSEYLYRGYYASHFARSIILPKNAKTQEIARKYDNGVLTLTLEKK